MRLRILRVLLGFAALIWGISAVGVFVSWSEAATLLEGMGAKPIAYDPMLDYGCAWRPALSPWWAAGTWS